ncbi:unnamed protein product [Natator depressus]
MGQPHSQHALGYGLEPLSQHAAGHGEEPLSQHAAGHGEEPLSQHALGYGPEPLSQHAMGHGEEPLSRHAAGHGEEPLSQHAMGQGEEPLSQHALGHGEEPLSQHAAGHGEEPLSQHALRYGPEPLSQHAMGHGEELLSQHAAGHGEEPLSQHAAGHGEEPLSQHAAGHGEEPLSQHATGHGLEPLSQHALGHGEEPLSQHVTGHGEEPLSQHAAGHGEELLSQHAAGHGEEPLSQHVMGHGEEPLSQHAAGHGEEPLSQHAAGHGEEPLSQHAAGHGEEPLSQHAAGHGEELLSQHATGHGLEPLSQHALGHSPEPLSQHAMGHGEEPLSQHATGHSPEPLSQHATGHGEEPLSQHAAGHGEEPLSQHALGYGPEPLSQHAAGHSEEPLSQHAAGHGEEPLSQPVAGARRVLFADALGLPLTRLRRYQPWPPPSPESPPEVLPPTGQPPPAPYLLPAFVLPPPGQGEPERLARLRRAMVELEEVLAPGPGEPWRLRGTVRVLNVAYRKAVHVRASRDHWRTYRDHPACYVPGGSPDGGLSDRFAFSLPFGPGQEGEEEGDEARLDFVIRYQTDEGVYWANNQGKNYSVVMKGLPPPRATPSTAGLGRQLKSCMRPERMRPCEEEPSDEDTPNPVDAEEGSPERETRRESPSAPPPQPTGQVPALPVASTSLETEPPAREPPQPPVAGTLGPGASFLEAGLEEQAGLWRAEEEAVDSELEQLYLCHLSRLRAEELGGAGGRPGGTEAAGSPPAWLPALHLSLLSDRDLVVGCAGPERALNSSLAQEITRHYASPAGEGLERGTAARLTPPAGPGRDSPPALLEGGSQGAGPGGALRLLASAAVVVPAWTAAPVGRGRGGCGGPRGLWSGEPREGAPGCPPRLGQALTHSLLVLGLVVVLPVVLGGCLPAAVITLYVVLTWRQAS